MKRLFLAGTLSMALMASVAAQGLGVDVDAATSGAGANADIGATVDADPSGAQSGVEAGAGANAAAGGTADAEVDAGIDAQSDTEAGVQTGTEAGTQAAGSASDPGALDGIGEADNFFTDTTRAELRSEEDVLTAFAAMTPEEQQLLRDRCDGEALAGDPDDPVTQLCAIIETR